MDVSLLPDDVLHEIFRNLYGSAVILCRGVCRRWKDAVDCLSDQDWKKICGNDAISEDLEEAHTKYGLSWRDTYKVLYSWPHISSTEMTTQQLCDEVDHFKVLPKGIVACLQNRKHKSHYGHSDTIVYYDTETSQKCATDEYKFSFVSHMYDENEYFKVLILFNCSLCIILKETNEQFIVGKLDSGYRSLHHSGDKFTLIGKEVYFKNSTNEIIYVSKLVNEKGKNTIKTEPLEAFVENTIGYEDTVVAFTIKNGNVNILSDEGNKGNIYVHENADFSWVAQPSYDQSDIFIELQEYGFNWKSSAIYNWLSVCSNLANRSVFYSHGNVYLTTRSYGRTICVFYLPYYIYGPDHLLKLFKGRPLKKITTDRLLPDDTRFPNFPVSQLDIVESTSSHKIMVLVAKKLFVLGFAIENHEQKKLKTPKVGKEMLLAKKISAATYRPKKGPVQKKKKTLIKKTTVKKALQTRKNTTNGEGSSRKHSYATRSST